MIAPSVRAGRIWDEATSAEASRLAEAFEARWRASTPGGRPDPGTFLPPTTGPEIGGLLLALLRADLALRREAGEARPLEAYRDAYPGLTDEALVALIYEDLCLREEAGERPDPAEYEGRFPALRSSLREVLEIHSLIRSAGPSATAPHDPGWRPSVEFLGEAFPTIAGFHLDEELGRGSFARVFLARERQLADRPVALKVSVNGSREPQALARLQHTHIVPVHSYRVDPATGLHLLVMPYFGRLTLAKLLADPGFRPDGPGSAVVDALDRLAAQADGPVADGTTAQRARRALAARPFGRAVAWWGAQLADALRHAHDRGVLHRDLKPSNILLTRDGVPMILDFNLAREVDLTPESARPGGTLAYMAPEHLAALLRGDDRAVDHRADVYALGLILAEVLGTPPLDREGPRETAAQLLDRRRRGPLGALGPVPRLSSGWQAILNRCLQAEPSARYADAGELAADLRALADDAPLVVAREPAVDRASRWARAHRRGLAAGSLAVLVVALWGVAVFQSRAQALRLNLDANRSLGDAQRSEQYGEYDAALVQYARAAERVDGRSDLLPLRAEAEMGGRRVAAASRARTLAEGFFEEVPGLQFAVLEFGGDPARGVRDLLAALKPFGVLDRADWIDSAPAANLDPDRRARLAREVDDLLFLWGIAAARSFLENPPRSSEREGRVRSALAFCDSARPRSALPGPWASLRDWWSHQFSGGPVNPSLLDPSASSSDAVAAPACFRLFLLGTLGSDRAAALTWLRQAVERDPGAYWPQFVLGFELARDGDLAAARARYDVAIALRPEFPWAWRNRGLLNRSLGEWRAARLDFRRAEAASRRPADRAQARLELGRTAQALGEFASARRDLNAATGLDPAGPTVRAAKLDLVRLAVAAGAWDQARASLDALIDADPADWQARSSRANLALRRRQVNVATADLDVLVRDAPEPWRSAGLRDRAALRLALGRPLDALLDLRQTTSPGPPAARRLADRARLALGQMPVAWPDDPADYDRLPQGGPALRADLRRLAGALADQIALLPEGTPDRATVRERRAIALAAAGDHTSARVEADRLAAESPRSADPQLVRARVERHARTFDVALAAIAAGLGREPDHPGLIELRGRIRVDRGEFVAGGADLAAASARGRASARGLPLARALLGVGRPGDAALLLGELAEREPDDPEIDLLLATAQRRRGRSEASLAALEAATPLVPARSSAAVRLALEYATLLPVHPDRLPRLITLARLGLLGD